VPTIWVYAEIDNGKLDPTSFELLTKARSIGDVEAVCLGPGATEAAAKLGAYGAEIVYASDDAVYGDYIAQPHVHALAELIGENAPDMILFPQTYDSRDIAGRLSARLGSTLMSNVMEIESVDKAKTAIFGGATIVDVALEGTPKIVVCRAKSFVPEESGDEATVVPVEVEIPEEAQKAKRVERHEEAASGPKLEEAPVVLSGGRGLGQPDNFKHLDELAKVLGNTAVGATRAVVDAGWVPYAYQIGQTGKTVKPSVYIAFGVSGATQHVVGMKGAKRIIAINKDEEAPIFGLADLGIVGDALKILPQLIEEIKSRK
jgi:electron transfer flavoprotein alpha subunit